jgi:hypothetical protein
MLKIPVEHNKAANKRAFIPPPLNIRLLTNGPDARGFYVCYIV